MEALKIVARLMQRKYLKCGHENTRNKSAAKYFARFYRQMFLMQH
jgi:hypothetical protein